MDNKISSKQSTVKACSNFLVAENFSLCVPATACSTTSTWRLTPLKGKEIQYGHQGHCRDNRALSGTRQGSASAQTRW